MKLPDDFLTRTGYRLPTEAEWLHACMGLAESILPYGSDQELNRQYAWYYNNSDMRSLPVGLLKPNDLGLFDMLGNVYEWCEPFPKGTGIAADLAGGGNGAEMQGVSARRKLRDQGEPPALDPLLPERRRCVGFLASDDRLSRSPNSQASSGEQVGFSFEKWLVDRLSPYPHL